MSARITKEMYSQPLGITVLESTSRNSLEIPVPVEVLPRLFGPPGIRLGSDTLLPFLLVLFKAGKVRFGVLAALETLGRRVLGDRGFVLSVLCVSGIGLFFRLSVGHWWDARKEVV
jgi:hypothetical protein